MPCCGACPLLNVCALRAGRTHCPRSRQHHGPHNQSKPLLYPYTASALQPPSADLSCPAVPPSAITSHPHLPRHPTHPTHKLWPSASAQRGDAPRAPRDAPVTEKRVQQHRIPSTAHLPPCQNSSGEAVGRKGNSAHNGSPQGTALRAGCPASHAAGLQCTTGSVCAGGVSFRTTITELLLE